MTVGRIWAGALIAFVLAGLTGVLYRSGMLFGLPAGLDFGGVRHAHSHLMYFSWVTPVLVAAVGSVVVDAGSGWRRLAWLTLGFGFLSYVPFLVSGYDATTLLGVTMPLSVATAGFSGVAWWLFARWYLTATRDRSRGESLRCGDAAVAFLVLASLAALGRGVVDGVGLQSLFARQAPIHAFLEIFADGWFVLGLLAVYARWHETGRPFTAGRRLATVGVPGAFLVTLPVGIVAPELRIVGSVAGAALSAGFGLMAVEMLRSSPPRSLWRLPAVFLLVRALAGILLVFPASAAWLQSMGLRILYLHVIALGVVTLGLVAVAREHGLLRAGTARHVWPAAVLVLLASLLPLTGVWPLAPGRGALWMALVAAVGPVLAAVASLRDVRPGSAGTIGPVSDPQRTLGAVAGSGDSPATDNLGTLARLRGGPDV